jgi:hypothetical protein
MARLRPTKWEIHQEANKDMPWGNFTSENVLLAHFPQSKKAAVLTDKVMQLAATARPALSGKKATLWDSLIGSGKERMVDADEVEWSLKGSGKIETLAKENLMPGVKFPGHNFEEFQIKLDNPNFVPGDHLAPEIAWDQQVVVQYLPVKDGLDSIYTVQLITLDPNAYFDPDLLQEGLKWIKVGASYSEYSTGYGSFQMTGNTSYIKFKTWLTDWGKTLEVTNKAHDLQLVLKPCDDKGLEINSIPPQLISWLEAEFIAESKWEKELMLWYGRAAGKNVLDHTSGMHRRIGPGIMEFMEDANVLTYPLGNFSIDAIRDFMQEVGWDTISPENANIVVKTGRMGMMQAHDSIRELYTMLNIQVPFDKFVKSGSAYPGSNSPGYKVLAPTFLEVDLQPFGSLRFEHLPLLDNRELNGGIVHPDTKLPLTSYAYFIMDYGLGSAGNIELLRKRDSQVYTYVCGTWSPVGPINGTTGRGGFTASHQRRSYQLFATDTFGARIKDVNLCLMILPSVTY